MKKVTRVIASVLILTMLLGNYAPMMQTVYAAQIIEEQKQELLDSFDSLLKDLPISDSFIYSDISDEWVSIYKYIGSEKIVSTPDTINGKSVVSVSRDAFADNEEIECVIIPASIVSIGSDAFSGCKSLNKIVLCGTEIEFDLTLADKCENLESVYVSNEFDSSTLEAILASDLGEDKAKEVNIIPCENVDDVVILFADPKDIPKSDNVEVSYSDEDEAEVATSSEVASVDTTASDEMTYEIVAPSDIELPQENDEPELQSQTETDDTEQSVTSEISEQNTEPEKADEEGKNVKAPVRSVQSYSDDFVIEDGVLVQYTGNGGAVEIPEGVTKIGENVFSDNYDITGIVIPEGVTEIGNWAFSYCGNLSCTLNLPDTVKIIGERAFCGSGITGTLTIPDGVTTIGEGAFEECGNLTDDIIVPGSVTSIGSWAFGNISEIIVFEGLTPPNVDESFAGWNYLETVYVPDETYDEYVSALSPKLDDSIDIFRISERIVRPSDIFDIEDHILVKYNGSDETVVIPDGVEHIGRRAFQNNKTVKSVVFPQGLKSIGDYAFQNCPTLTGDLVIPDGVESIGRNAFYFCEGLDGTLSLPNGLISIGKWAFLCCRNLHGDLTIPDSVTSIGEDAFCACGFSGKLFLPNNTFSFGDYAFTSSPIKYIYFSSLIPPSVNDHSFEYMPGLIAMYVPDEAYDDYREAFSGYLADDIQVRKRSSESVPTGDFVIIDGVLEEYVGNGGVVEIPDGVTSIGRGVFYQNKTITGVVFPQNLHSIGARAFQDCSSMTGDLIIPDSVTQIGEYAFAGCEGLNGNLVISKGITEIADGVFQNCSFSGNLTIPDGVVSIGNYAFQSCWALGGTITLPDGLKSLGCWAFSDCVSLSGSLTVPEGVEYVGECPIVNTGITSIVFEGISVPVFGDDGFKWDESLRRIYVPDESYESYLSALNGIISSSIVIKKKSEIGVSFSTDEFDVLDGMLVHYKGSGGVVEIPDGVTDIYDYVFCCNSEITGIVFPSGLQTIGQGAFDGCERLSGNLTLPDSLTRIGSSSFWGCSSLRGTLIIPENIEFVGQGAFNYSGLTSLVFESKDVPQFEEKAFYWNDSLKRIYVPDEAYDSYLVALRGKISGSISIKRKSEMGLTSDTNGFIIEDGVLVEYIGEGGIIEIPEGVTDIANNVFCSNTSITAVVFPEGLQSIGANAFAASGLSGQLVLPSSLKIIGYSAFRDCSELTGDLLIPNGVTKISNSAFENCSGFNGVLSIPDSVKSIEYSAFDRCSGLTGDLVIPDSVTYVGAFAFFGCSGFNGTLSISNSLTSIEAATFNGCSNFTGDIFIPDKVKTIDNCAFYFCSGFNGSLVLPNGLNTIGDSAFYGCSRLKGNLIIPDSVTNIGESAFNYCSGFNGNLVISRGLTSINGWTFKDCSGFTCNLIIPYNVTSIGYSAFSGCSGFKGELVLPAAVNTIGGFAFSGCSGFTGRLVVPDSVKQIGESAFQQCSGLTGVGFPEGIESIEDHTFNLCEGLTGDLIIPESVKTIGERAFAGCRGLNGNLVIPDSITNLGNDAFYSCESVREIVFRSTVPASLSNETVFSCMNKLTRVTVPSSAYQAYIEAYSGIFSDSVSIVADVVYSKVTGLVKLQSLSGTVGISWDECTDEDVVGYVIYRNGNEVGTTGECTFIDRQLESNREYTYAVTGYDNNGFETEAVGISVSTSPFSIYSLSTNADEDMLYNNDSGCYNVITAVANDYDRIIFASQVDENSGSARLYYLNSNERVLIGEHTLSDCENADGKASYNFEWENIDELQDGVYTIVFCLTDIDGISTEMYKTVKIANHRPQTIINVMATEDVSSILISWSMSSEVDTNTYCIYRQVDDGAFERIARLYDSRYTLNYVDTDVEPEKKYSYYVTGESRYGIEGKPSLIAVAYLGTDEEKPVVTKMTPANNSFIKGNTTITVTAQDNVGISHLTVSYSDDEGETWSNMGEFENKPYVSVLDTTSLSDGKILIKAHAVDLAGNESDPLIYAYYVDNTGPEKVNGLSYTSTSVTVTLSWSDVTDNDISYFRVEKKDAATADYSKVTDVTKTLGANIYGLTPDTSYIYRVVGYDIHGNRGTPSDDITVQTKPDTTAPVITSINPKSGRYSNNIALSVTAKDEYSVAKIVLQLSLDEKETWQDIYTKEYTNTVSTATVSYQLSLADYEEGYIYIRAVAYDKSGNVSETSETAPSVQHLIDKTVPAAPQNVKAESENGYVCISWTQGSESDLNTYCVYRSDSEDGTYSLVKGGLKTISYYDRNVNENTTYYYKLAVNDQAGNMSEFSSIVSSLVAPDSEKPKIVSVYPTNGSRIGEGYKTISTLVTDNKEIDAVIFEYKVGLGFYSEFNRIDNINSYNQNVTATLPIDEFDDGDTIYIRITAIDKTGNRSEFQECQYVIDKIAPTVESVYASYDDGAILVSWNGLDESDLIGYRIYRKTGNSDDYTIISQKKSSSGLTLYSFSDSNLSLNPSEYTYRIEALDDCGNSSTIESLLVATPDRRPVDLYITCDSNIEEDVEYIFEASISASNQGYISYLFDFGDGSTNPSRKAIHKYDEPGTYEISLTATDSEGNQFTVTKSVEVKERVLIGYGKIQVVDENGYCVPNAPVFFDLGEDNYTVKNTDANGFVTFISETGKHSVGCIIPDNNWLPVKKEIIIQAQEETSLCLTMVHRTLVDGNFEIKRMTFEDIVAAGIDVTKPENQYMVHIDIHLKYGQETIETNMIYNTISGAIIARPIILENRQFIPVVICSREHITQVSVAYIDIPIGVSMLKDFFDVNLHIINNSSTEFSMLNNVITLNLPEGLTIMNTNVSQQSNTVSIPEIKGQTTETITWIIRGDKVGEYNLSADYIGVLSEFDVPIQARFESDKPLTVTGLSNVVLDIKIPDAIEGEMFYYNIKATNTGSEKIYMPRIETSMEPEMTFIYDADGTNMIGPDNKISDAMLEDVFRSDEVTCLESGQSVEMHYIAGTSFYNENPLRLTEMAVKASELYGLTYNISPISIYSREFVHPIGNYIGADHNLYYNGYYTSDKDGAMKNGSDGYQAFNTYPFTFSDSYFNQSSYGKYNHQLADFSFGLAFAGMNKGDTSNDKHTSSVSNRDENVKDLLIKCGFKERTFCSYGYDIPTDINTMAVAFAQKEIDDSIVLAVVIRGGNYGREWGGDFLLGKQSESDEHKGFLIEKNYVLDKMNRYLGNSNLFSNPLNKQVKLLITGYSRGAATANLVSAEIDNIICGSNTSYGNIKKLNIGLGDVFSYTFETPRNTTDTFARDVRYNNIFNIVNPADFVPKVAPKNWNFIRYGTDIFLPSESTVSSFDAVSLPMRFQYKVVFGISYPYYVDIGNRCLDVTLDRIFDSLADNWVGSRDKFSKDLEKVIMCIAAGTLGKGFDEEVSNEIFNSIKSFLAGFIISFIFHLVPSDDAVTSSLREFSDSQYEKKKEALIDTLVECLPTVSGDPTVQGITSSNIESFLNLIRIILLDAIDLDIPIQMINSTIKHVTNNNEDPTDDMFYNAFYSPIYTTVSLPITMDILFSLFRDAKGVTNVKNMHEATVCMSWLRALKYNKKWLSAVNNNPSASGKYSMVFFDDAVNVDVYSKDGEKIASVLHDDVTVTGDKSIGVFNEGKNIFIVPLDENYTFYISSSENVESVYCSYKECDYSTGVSKVLNYHWDVTQGKEYSAQIDSNANSLEKRFCLKNDLGAIEPEVAMTSNNISYYDISYKVEGDGNISGSTHVICGDSTNLLAVPDDSSDFKGWYINDQLISSEPLISFTPESDVEITARFGCSVESISLEPSSDALHVGDNMSISFAVLPENASYKTLSWTSSDEFVATVDENGVVTAVGVGTVEITATAINSVKARCLISVSPIPDDEWTLNKDDHTLRGVPEETTPDELISHYQALGLTVTVADADGNEPDLIGTGCIVSVNGEEFTVIVNGDVTGDGEIDVFDLFAMTDHLNDNEELTGVYFIAACYLGNEEFDLFDLFAVQAHINQD